MTRTSNLILQVNFAENIHLVSCEISWKISFYHINYCPNLKYGDLNCSKLNQYAKRFNYSVNTRGQATTLSSLFIIVIFSYFTLLCVFSGLGYIVGSSVTHLTGDWHWALRVRTFA